MFEPLEDRIFVLPDEAKKVTDAGLIIPEQAQRRPAAGTVMFVGPGKKIEGETILFKIYLLICKFMKMEPEEMRTAMRVKPGDRVIFGSYAGTEQPDLNDPKKLYLIMRITDVFAKI